MFITTLENFLRNSSFICLFFTMLLYWINGGLFSKQKIGILENIAIAICNLLLILLLTVRWIDSNHFPLSNLYESLIFLSWSLLFFLFLLQNKTKESFLGIILTPIILFTTTFASFSLPVEMQKATSLVPALQSNWLMMHVTIMILSYAALICGSLLAALFLILMFFSKQEKINIPVQLEQSTITGSFENAFPNSTSIFSKIEDSQLTNPTIVNQNNFLSTEKTFLQKIDNISYRTIGIGFPLLTIGILSGAVWANETWGSYWSWDPKETWAFITWLIYSIYLHSRIIKGWKGKKPAFIATIGFFAVWVCYLGVNIFGKGLHSYGWFS